MTKPTRICATGLGILCLVLWVSSSLAAEGRRGFTGFYQARTISQGPLTVQVRLTIRIFNNTRAGVSAGILELRDSIPPYKVLGTFDPVSVNARTSVEVTGDFAISTAEYARWREGGRPELTLEYSDADGNPQSRSVELARGNVGTEE